MKICNAKDRLQTFFLVLIISNPVAKIIIFYTNQTQSNKLFNLHNFIFTSWTILMILILNIRFIFRSLTANLTDKKT